MGLRARLGRGLESTLGRERTDRIRSTERRTRRLLADRIAPPAPPAPRGGQRPAAPGPARKPAPSATSATSATSAQQPKRRGSSNKVSEPRPEGRPERAGWLPSDPFVPHPHPDMSRHDLLRGLHEVLNPRTYLEIGVNTGASLALSRARTVAVDPEFLVRQPVRCDLDLVKAKSDDFFARPDALSHLEGVPVDLAFIDGMHLSEYAFRDFVNVEKHLARTGVAVFDDVLPRNGLEAARDRVTGAWAGDVYKAVEVIARHRPDLVVLLVNTSPTGTAVIVGADPASAVLQEVYDTEVSYFEAADPQTPPQEYMDRSIAVDPAELLASEAWPLLVAAREDGDRATLDKALAALRSVPTLG